MPLSLQCYYQSIFKFNTFLIFGTTYPIILYTWSRPPLRFLLWTLEDKWQNFIIQLYELSQFWIPAFEIIDNHVLLVRAFSCLSLNSRFLPFSMFYFSSRCLYSQRLTETLVWTLLHSSHYQIYSVVSFQFLSDMLGNSK